MVTMLLFGICCGVLYVLAAIFGVSYEEMSVIICVDGVIWTCVISIIIPLLVSLWKFALKPSISNGFLIVFLSILVSLYLVNAGMYYDYQIPEADYYHNFHWVMTKLQEIARSSNTTYEFVNILIYCIIFPLIVLSNLFITVFICKRFPKKSSLIKTNK